MEYTLSEFRKKTREAFNKAEALDDVIIERYGLRYRLTRADDLPNNTVSAATGLYPKVIKKQYDVLKEVPVSDRFGQGLCKIHGTPLDSRGKCLQKGCKYA